MICIEHLKCCNLDLHVECASKNTAFIFLISNLYRNNCLLIIKIQQPEEVHYIWHLTILVLLHRTAKHPKWWTAVNCSQKQTCCLTNNWPASVKKNIVSLTFSECGSWHYYEGCPEIKEKNGWEGKGNHHCEGGNHPAHSPDLTPSNFHSFLHLKNIWPARSFIKLAISVANFAFQIM